MRENNAIPEEIPTAAAGFLLACPECFGAIVVYHFEWSSITCESCREDIEKHNAISIGPHFDDPAENLNQFFMESLKWL